MPPLSSFFSFPTKHFSPDSLYIVGIITLISGFQLASFARRVGNCRRKYKIKPPQTDGDENFVRCFRAQQNCLEFYPIFMVSTWMTAMFFHQLPAALIAVYYLFEREKYFVGYSANADLRWKPFHRSANALKIQALIAAIGLFNVAVRHLSGRDLLQTFGNGIWIPV